MTDIKRLPQGEFIALIAALFATIAISIDAMLPALPQIAASLSPDAPNRAQLVVTSFVFGMGLGTLFAGPLADAFGRKSVIMFGTLLYAAASIACYFANTLDFLLIARVIQGIGAEPVLRTVREARAFGADAVLVPGNWVPLGKLSNRKRRQWNW